MWKTWSHGQLRRRPGALADFLAVQVFGRWDLVLHYDLARGLRLRRSLSA
jgi:hypothetical protein